MLIVFQDLTIEMNGEQFWLRTHSNQMPADVVMGTHGYIWHGTIHIAIDRVHQGGRRDPALAFIKYSKH